MIGRFSRRAALAILVLFIGVRGSAAEQEDPRALVVMITLKSGTTIDKSGAGIIVKQTKSPRQVLIVTAMHVVEKLVKDPPEIQVAFRQLPGRIFRAKPTDYVDEALDLAVLTVESADLPELLTPALAARVTTIPAEALQGRQVFFVGHTNGRPWEQGFGLDKVSDASPTELRVDSKQVEGGTSGGAMFDAEASALAGMVRASSQGKAVVLPIQLVLERLRRWDIVADLRADSSSDRIGAQRQLVERGYPVTAAGLAQALIAADTGNLALFSKARVPSAVVGEALRTLKDGDTTAQRYFEATRAPNSNIRWLEEALKQKDDPLDPNLRIPHRDIGEEAIINVAERAANVPAVMALLKAGASPHGYQSIRNWAHEDPRFLFPFGSLWKDTKLGIREKGDLFRALLNSGAVVVRIPPLATDGGVLFGPIAHETKLLMEAIQSATGLPFQPTPNLCEQIPKAACERDTKRYRVNWCEVVRTVPRVVGRLVPPARDDVYVPAFIVRYYLGANARTAYFLAELLDYASGYALLEVSADLQNLRLVRYTNLRWYGTGSCIGDEARSRICWTELSLTRDARTGHYNTELGPPAFPVSWSCDDAAAQANVRAQSIVPRPFQHQNPQVAACVNDILRIPRSDLLDEASRLNIFAVRGLTLDAKTCVLAEVNVQTTTGNAREASKNANIKALAQQCCEKIVSRTMKPFRLVPSDRP